MSPFHKPPPDVPTVPLVAPRRLPPVPPPRRACRRTLAKVVRFGEFLVERHLLDREQLLAALMAQDYAPGVPLGAVVAALGFVDGRDVEHALDEFLEIEIVEVG